MIIDTLAAIIILLNGVQVPLDSLQSFFEPKTDTTIYAVVGEDTIWQAVDWTPEKEDSILRKQFGVGINKFQKAIEDIQNHKFAADKVKNIQLGRQVIDKEELSRIFVVHPDTFAIWTKWHDIIKHSEQYKEYNLFKKE